MEARFLHYMPHPSSDIATRDEAAAMAAYYIAAWKDGNENVSYFMLQQAIDQQWLAFLTVTEDVTVRILSIGRSILKAQLAAKWLKIALQVVETRAKPESISSAQDDEQRSGSLPTTLIKQLNFPGEDRTESGSPSKEIVEEFRQLQWMKTAILKRRNASDTEFREVLQGLLHSIEFSEECINDFLQEMSALAEARPNHALRDVNGHSFIDKIRFHLKADANQQRATLEIGSACDDTAGRPGFQFGKRLLEHVKVLWDMGDKLYNSNKWSRAVRWYCLSSHEIFARAVAPVTLGEYSQAVDCLQRCQADGTTNEAATHYLSFLAAIHQAAEAITRLLAHEKQLRLSLLHSLLETSDNAPVANGGSEGILLSRCIIGLTIDLLKEPAAEMQVVRCLNLVHILNLVHKSCFGRHFDEAVAQSPSRNFQKR
ncbi:uncharacterized protein EI90DRAFT_3088369 [Cantharellus anzutake]|uniref:uncharacterized protein n=1 Tax=Cantharellus anzutake TaxID=1750568 RepID=UPI0019056DDD|nr:uncharacterized protein EI90DRAFT_3088369 [Cantharellus anzutake]KAF8315265.1 hypothetical protein EI90DRAFT_3088369 [Cantharellus anzutake]